MPGAGVLVAQRRRGGKHVVFIQHEFRGNNSRYFAIPGGDFDKRQDNDLADTAARELVEEWGLKKNAYTHLRKSFHKCIPIRMTYNRNTKQINSLTWLLKTYNLSTNYVNRLRSNGLSNEVKAIYPIPLAYFYNKKYPKIFKDSNGIPRFHWNELSQVSKNILMDQNVLKKTKDILDDPKIKGWDLEIWF